MSTMRGDQPGPEELEERIKGCLLTVITDLSSLNMDITLYLFHHIPNIHHNPFNRLDEFYTIYEERANECRRLWIRLRAASKNQTSFTRVADNPSSSKSRLDLETSPSPLEYQSEFGADELAETRGNDRAMPMDVDPVKAEQDPPQLSALVTDLRITKSKKSNIPPRTVMITPSGPTSCRLAPIPKGAKLTVETTRFPPPQKPYTFQIPQQPIINDSERRPLNRTKHNRQDAQSSKKTPLPSSSSLQSSSQQVEPSTAQTSILVSPRENHSSAKEYWEPRRAIHPDDFQMDEDHLFNSLDCLGPPLRVNTAELTHSNTPATPTDLRMIYGGKFGLTPKISAEKLGKHGFDHWMVPKMDFHPFLPPQPGWPGLMLRLDDEVEEWRPDEGTEFRVVIKCEPHFLEYVGQYEMVRLDDITGDEWKKQPPKVKKRWTQVLGGGRLWNDTVARVALRKKLGKEPSIEDFKKFIDKLTPDSYTTLAKDLKEDIDRAFCEGEEVIAIWGMKCVGYDYKFEKHLARSLKARKPSLPESTKKRKVVFSDDHDTGSGDDDENKVEDSESDDSLPSKRQRIAKGKAKLMKYDWSGAKFEGDSEDGDYKPT